MRLLKLGDVTINLDRLDYHRVLPEQSQAGEPDPLGYIKPAPTGEFIAHLYLGGNDKPLKLDAVQTRAYLAWLASGSAGVADAAPPGGAPA